MCDFEDHIHTPLGPPWLVCSPTPTSETLLPELVIFSPPPLLFSLILLFFYYYFRYYNTSSWCYLFILSFHHLFHYVLLLWFSTTTSYYHFSLKLTLMITSLQCFTLRCLFLLFFLSIFRWYLVTTTTTSLWRRPSIECFFTAVLKVMMMMKWPYLLDFWFHYHHCLHTVLFVDNKSFF